MIYLRQLEINEKVKFLIDPKLSERFKRHPNHSHMRMKTD